MKMALTTQLYFIIVLLLSCGTPSTNSKPSAVQKESPKSNIEADTFYNVAHAYDFATPSQIYVLDTKLKEISGLAYDMGSQNFYCHNDEHGHIYTLNRTDFSIKEKIKFHRSGDYEAIAKVENKIVVCKSNGTLYFYDTLSTETRVVKTKLKTQNNAEGLCYDSNSNQLLLACKGQPMNLEKSKKQKHVYAFDLVNENLDPNPFIAISDSALVSLVTQKAKGYSKTELKKLTERAKEFSPSGIAMHPKSGAYYILSAKGSTIAIYDVSKKLADIIFLKSKTIPQPEGITFDKDGNLFLATEGQSFRAKIFKYFELANAENNHD